VKPNWVEVARLAWSRQAALISLLIAIILGLVAIALVLSDLARDSVLVVSGVFFIALVVVCVRAWRDAQRTLQDKAVPVVVIVGKTDDEYRRMWDDVITRMRPVGFDMQELERDWRIRQDDLVLRHNSHLPRRSTEWEQLASQFQQKILSLSARIPGTVTFHLFLNCPAALALGLGATLTTRYRVVLYHHWGGGDYQSVLSLTGTGIKDANEPHTLKQRVVEPYRNITVEWPANADVNTDFQQGVFVSVGLASHDPKGDTLALARTQNLPAIHICNTYNDNLQRDSDWLRVEQETAVVLLGLAAKGVKRLHLCVSSPVVLAFAIGMTLGVMSPITVYNWFPDAHQYSPVLDLDTLISRRRP
jgi:hypothetical protein